MTKANDFVEANLERLCRPGALERYTAPRDLLTPELAILARVATEFRGKRILDLGVGGGQTTPALLEISDNYLGTDVIPQMVSLCRKRFPAVRFEVCDARQLSNFPDNSFDLIVFFGAGLDAIDHQDRIRALREIYRMLTPNGAFAFSSHNLRSPVKRPWHPSKLPWRTSPLLHPREFARRSKRFFSDTLNHLRRRRYEKRGSGYALLNDEADHFGFILYYILVEDQIKQLTEAGFSSVLPIDLSGNCLTTEVAPGCRDTWVHYLCRK